MAETLQRAGFEVPEVARSAAQAFELAARLKPELVLAEVTLADGGDGIQVVAEVLRSGEAPVVYLAACADFALLERAKENACYGFLVKPIDGRTLVATVEVAIHRFQEGRRRAEEALRQRDEELRQAQKMEAMGRLAGGVAHDFNNILQAMLSLTQVLRVRRQDKFGFADAVEELDGHVKRGAALTRQLLLFSRRETPHPEQLDLNEIVQDNAKMLRRLVRENIKVAVELASEPLLIDGDRGQLGQVLMNLVVNACDAMAEGGELHIRSGRGAGSEVWMEVRDTGCGMAPELVARIFEPFFTTKGAGKGTGLGLA
ncbi:MAG: ATP-binding protein, partial [Acidobacteriota bacterium]